MLRLVLQERCTKEVKMVWYSLIKKDVELGECVLQHVLTRNHTITGIQVNLKNVFLCYPRLETGQAPACMHSCVGRIRYLGVMLYDADRIEKVAASDDKDLLYNHLDIYVDPNDPLVIKAARKAGIHDSTIEAAQKSPVYKFVKEWGIALPLHPEFRTLPNLFYVPPMLPAMAQVDEKGLYETTV